MTKEVLAVFGTLIAVVVVLTMVGGGNFRLGTTPGKGPFFQLGFQGPQGPQLVAQ